jgi:cytochrome c oxidase cbb3-type subunit 2
MNRKTSRTITLATVFSTAFIVNAQKPQDRPQPGGDNGPVARLREAPASARSLENPLAGDSQAATAGRKLYLRHCAQCHGGDGKGLGRAANLRSPALQSAPPGVLFWAIRNGRLRKGMPSWSDLPDQRLWQVVTYLKSLYATHNEADRR